MNETYPFILGYKNEISIPIDDINLFKLEEIDGEIKFIIINKLGNLNIINKGIKEYNYQIQSKPRILYVTFFNLGHIIHIACSNKIFMFLNKNIYFKFEEIFFYTEIEENQIWDNYDGELDKFEEFFISLENLKESKLNLSPISLNLLEFDNKNDSYNYYKENKFQKEIQDYIVTLGSLKYSELTKISSLIIGTELKQIIILNEDALTINFKFKIEIIPFIIKGILDDNYNYCLFIVSRFGKLYFYKKDKWYKIVNTNGFINYIEIKNEKIFLNTDNGLEIWNKNLEFKLKTIILENNIRSIDMTPLGITVANNDNINIYNENGNLILSTKMEDTIIYIKYSNIKKENAFFVIYKTKGIQLLFFKRDFVILDNTKNDLNLKNDLLYFPIESNFEEENKNYEIKNYKEHYNNFKVNNIILKKIINEKYYDSLKNNNFSENENYKLFLDLKLIGSGPDFIIKIILRNEGDVPLFKLFSNIIIDDSRYNVIKSSNCIKSILPGITNVLNIQIRSINNELTPETEATILISNTVLNYPLIVKKLIIPLIQDIII